MSLTERKALVAYYVSQNGKHYLKLGPGDHTCDVWELTDAQAKLMLVDLAREILTTRLYPEGS